MTKDVKYIGSTSNPDKRRLEHNTHGNSTYRTIKWKQKLKKKNLKPIFEIIEVVPSREADEREKYWIEHYNQSFKLLNTRHNNRSWVQYIGKNYWLNHPFAVWNILAHKIESTMNTIEDELKSIN